MKSLSERGNLMKIFLASHGRLASGLASSAKVLLGNTDKLVTFDAYVDESNLEDAIHDFLTHVDEGEQVIFVSDLFGGSVNQVLYQQATRPNTFLVAGANLAIVMELLLKPADITRAELDAAIDSSRQALQCVEIETTDVEEEEFF